MVDLPTPPLAGSDRDDVANVLQRIDPLLDGMGGDLPADLDLHVLDPVDGAYSFVECAGQGGAMSRGREAKGDADLDASPFDVQ